MFRRYFILYKLCDVFRFISLSTIQTHLLEKEVPKKQKLFETYKDPTPSDQSYNNKSFSQAASNLSSYTPLRRITVSHWAYGVL